MRRPTVDPDRNAASLLQIRPAWFEDVAEVLRLIERSIELGCREHYDPPQRRAVFLAYAQSLFLDVLQPFETVVARSHDRLVGFAQLDPDDGRLRALFVDADAQGCGHGQALLTWISNRARVRGVGRVHGAMSLNAVPFYLRAGFRACAGRVALGHGGVAVPVLPMEKLLGR